MSHSITRAGGLVLVLFSLLLGLYGTGSLATAAGLSGTGGTLTVTGCRTDVSYGDRDREDDDRHATRRCWGRFSAEDGSAADPEHELVSDEARPGDRIEVRDNGTIYIEPGAGSVAGAAAIVSLAVGMALFGVLILVTGRHPLPSRPAQARAFATAVRALPFGRGVLFACLGAWALTAVGFGLQKLL
ncbi:hypothetical protein [Streptomyces antimicrobicus]|uniref:Uncharacterized protein n=1 Tax=Streptomyces antimicrobicus TaxID=2883108 RepID=A0ABS8B6R3_9ACTN|nr:hypothetical protein [Streptomyces antimicrobicus]MCB5180303.1 hypothetical protein [Streptomyces antimicrobicus]